MDNAAFDNCESNGDVRVVQHQQREHLQLKRKIDLPNGVAMIVGNMIGIGIFVTPSDILSRTGSVGLSFVMWLVCGLVAILGSLSYAELGTLIPKSGGEYIYFIEGLKQLHSFWGPLPAFLYSWITILMLRPNTLAVGCLSFASYTVVPLVNSMGLCLTETQTAWLPVMTAVLCLCLVTALNCYSVSWTVRVQSWLTLAKLGAIAAVVGGGIYELAIGKTEYLAQGFQGSNWSFGAIATAFYAGSWTYDGWNNLNYMTEELKDPHINLPRAIMIGIPFVTLCYLALNVAYLTVLSPEQMIASKAVAADFAKIVFGPASGVIPVAVALSMIGGLLSTTFATGRVCFACAREGHMISILSYVGVDSLAPTPGLVFTAILAVVYLIPGDISSLIDLFSMTVWIFYVLAMIVLLILRKTKADAHRPYKVPIIAPVLIIIIGVCLTIAPLVTNPTFGYFYVLVAFLIGFVFYVVFVYYAWSLPYMGAMTRTIQLLMKVGPTKLSDD